jgi:hypothetical protein
MLFPAAPGDPHNGLFHTHRAQHIEYNNNNEAWMTFLLLYASVSPMQDFFFMLAASRIHIAMV